MPKQTTLWSACALAGRRSRFYAGSIHVEHTTARNLDLSTPSSDSSRATATVATVQQLPLKGQEGLQQWRNSLHHI